MEYRQGVTEGLIWCKTVGTDCKIQEEEGRVGNWTEGTVRKSVGEQIGIRKTGYNEKKRRNIFL